MQVKVTMHAIKRYRERFLDFASSNSKIRTLLKDVARKGKPVQKRPADEGDCTEVRYKGIAIVIVHDKGEMVVITCLGNESYRKWVKHQGKNYPNGRLLYPAKAI